METSKYTIGLVFQLVFGVAAIGTYLAYKRPPELDKKIVSFCQVNMSNSKAILFFVYYKSLYYFANLIRRTY